MLVAMADAADRLSFRQYVTQYPVTSALIAFNLAVFVAMVCGAALAKPFQWAAVGDRLLHPSSAILIRWGADFGPLTLGGQWWRLVTAIFVHIGVIHVLTNLWVLFSVGPIAESIWGRRTYLFIYLFSGVAGSVISVWWNPVVPSAGASGALFGVAGALLISLRWGQLPFSAGAVRMAFLSILALVGVNLFYGLTQRVDNAAHIGGLAAGLIAGTGLLLAAKPRAAEQASAESELTLTPVMAAFLVLVLAGCGAGAWWARRYIVPMERGRMLMERNQVAAAIPDLRQATRIGWGKRSSETHRLLAEASIRRGDFGTAQANLILATELNPRDAEAWSTLGLLYLGTRRPREASVALARAAELNPKSAAIRYNLGVAYIGSRQWDQAVATLQPLTKELPNDPDVYRALAFAYHNKGMDKEAEAAMQRSSELRGAVPRQ
jgi:membrane associated rhomboid family serine protease